MLRTFTLLEFGESEDADVLFLETTRNAIFRRDKSFEPSFYRELFDELREVSLSPDESREGLERKWRDNASPDTHRPLRSDLEPFSNRSSPVSTMRHPSGNGNSIECPEGFDALGRRIILTARLPDSGKLCRVAIQNESMLIRDFREPEWRDTLSHMLGVARVRPGDGNPSASSTSS
jgi:hypothetical protein